LQGPERGIRIGVGEVGHALLQSELAAQTRDQRVALVQQQKANCRLHISELFSGSSVSYQTLQGAKGWVVKYLRRRAAYAADQPRRGRRVILIVTPDNCVRVQNP
jgi:hypothetical protein